MQTPIVYIDGLFWNLENANISVLDRGFAYGDGLFETMRAYSGNIFRLEQHLDRLIKSARSILIELPITRNELKLAIYAAIKINGLSSSTVKITVTRGRQEQGINIDHSSPPTIVILVKPVKKISKKDYNKGVGVKVFKNCAIKIQGISNPIKSCNYLSNIMLRENALQENFFEAILTNHKNNITEGTISNIFIVKNDQVITPALNEFILGGVMRKAILDLCLENSICYKEAIIKEKDLYEADEIFITNSGIEILPVSNINNYKRKKKCPGPITKHVHALLLKSFVH